MEHNEKLKKYYAYGLVPNLLLGLGISVLFNIITGAFFLLGFIWPYLYYAPGFEEKANSKAYKFSFLGNIYKFQKWLFSLTLGRPGKLMKALARLVIPLILSIFMCILNPSWAPLSTFLGWASFEYFTLLNEKKNWNLL